MCKVLIVDDNISDREGLREFVDWQSMGISEIKFAKNGAEGYEKAKECKPALVITDVSMPIMDGLEMAKKIIEDMPKTKFIFMSCFDDTDYICESMDYNAYGYLLKPINVEKFVSLVEKILKINRNEDETNKNVQRLERRAVENVPYIREIITRDIVYGTLAKMYVPQLEDINMGVKKFYSVVVAELMENSDDYIDRNCKTIYDIKECMTNDVVTDMRISSFLQSRQTLVLVIYFDKEENEQECMTHLLDYLSTSKEYINKKFGRKVIICTAGIATELDEAAKMFNSIEHTLKTNIYEMGNNIVLAENQVSSETGFDCDIMKLKQQITEMFADNDFSRLKNFIDERYDMHGKSKNSVKAFTYTLISILQLVLLERNESFADVFGDNVSVWTKLSDYNTIFDIRQWIMNIFEFVYTYLDEKSKNKDKYIQTVDKIKTVINEEYGTIENIGQISNRIYISASYANHIFKKYEGITMFEYLVQVRMEKAKELLANTDMSISEISESVGYNSNAYFTTVFREYEGQTPKRFRNRRQKV